MQHAPRDDVGGGLVVARYFDGTSIRGKTFDFSPARDRFHIYVDGDTSRPPARVEKQLLKALFFVKSLRGDGRHGEFTFENVVAHGRRGVVMLQDLEMIPGVILNPSPEPGDLTIVPAQRDSNNTRVFVPRTAIRQFRWL